MHRTCTAGSSTCRRLRCGALANSGRPLLSVAVEDADGQRAVVIAAVASLVCGAAGAGEDSPLFSAMGVLLVGTLLTLAVTGSVMLVQHDRPARRSARVR